MSSVSTKNGNVRIQFFNSFRQRKSIRLGRLSRAEADRYQANIDALNEAAIARRPWPPTLARWVKKLGPTLYDKLAAAELVPPRKKSGPPETLAAFLDAYIAGRDDAKERTRDHLRRVRNDLVAYFGASRRLDSITAGDADEFRRWLARDKKAIDKRTGKEKTRKGLEDNTIRRVCGRAKQFFRHAARKQLIVDSPFADMADITVKANKARDFQVTREMAAQVLDACIDDEWRLIFALARFGGIRVPSELLRLR